MNEGILYDPSEDPQAQVAVPNLPMMTDIPREPPSLMQGLQTRMGQVGSQLGQWGSQIGNGISQGIQGIQDKAQQDPGLFLAAAAGIGKGTPMGEMASSINDHFKLQAEMKQKKDANDALMSLNRDKLGEAQRLNNSKIDANTAKALKDGTAKVTNLNNGFISVMKPGDTIPTEIAYGDYQNFLREQTQTKGENLIRAAGAKIEATPKSPAQEKLEGEAIAKAQQASTTLDRWQRAKSLLEAQGAPELAGLPFVSRIAQILGSDTTSAYQVLSQLKVDEGFTNIPHGQGSMSNIEREMLMAPIPSMDASTDVWLNYINRRLPVIEQAATKHQAYADQITNQPRNAVDTMEKVIAANHKDYGQGTPQAPQNAPQQPSRAQPQVSQPAPAAKPMQQYPKGFNPPSNGRSPPEDQLAILKQEFADESAKPESPGKQSNLTALRAELTRLGFKPQDTTAAPAASGPMKFDTESAAVAAYKAGKLKSGDTYIGPDGKKRKVH